MYLTSPRAALLWWNLRQDEMPSRGLLGYRPFSHGSERWPLANLTSASYNGVSGTEGH